ETGHEARSPDPRHRDGRGEARDPPTDGTGRPSRPPSPGCRPRRRQRRGPGDAPPSTHPGPRAGRSPLSRGRRGGGIPMRTRLRGARRGRGAPERGGRGRKASGRDQGRHGRVGQGPGSALGSPRESGGPRGMGGPGRPVIRDRIVFDCRQVSTRCLCGIGPFARCRGSRWVPSRGAQTPRAVFSRSAFGRCPREWRLAGVRYASTIALTVFGLVFATVFAVPVSVDVSPADETFTFAVAGDIGWNETGAKSQVMLRALQRDKANLSFFLADGDLSYNTTAGTEGAWCDFVKS